MHKKTVRPSLRWLWSENFYQDQNCTRSTQNKLQTYIYQGTKVDSPLSNQEPDIPVVLFSCSTSAGNVHRGAQSSLHSRKRAKIRVRLHAWVPEYMHEYMQKIVNIGVSAPNSNFLRLATTFIPKDQQPFSSFFGRWLPCAWPSMPKITPRRSAKITTLRCPRLLAMFQLGRF